MTWAGDDGANTVFIPMVEKMSHRTTEKERKRAELSGEEEAVQCWKWDKKTPPPP